MATHSSSHAWEIPRTEEPGRLQSIELDTTEWLSMHPGMGAEREYMYIYVPSMSYGRNQPNT